MRRATAWWVNPTTGEVIPVRAHALTVAEDPERFGLTWGQVRAFGVPAKGPWNYFDEAPDSPRQRLLALVTRNGWVRVRQRSGSPHLIQVHGDLETQVIAALHCLAKHGHRLRGSLKVIDPAAGVEKIMGPREPTGRPS